MASLLQLYSRAALLCVLFLTFTTASGQSLWMNPIDATAPGIQNPYTTGDVKDANIAVSGIGRGTGITGNAGTGRYNTTGWSTANAVNSDEYFTFTLTPNPGYKINFTSLVFTLQRSTTGPDQFAVRSSIDNFTSNIDLITATGTTGAEKTVTLSAASFQNVAAAITLRIYGYNASGATGTASINDFTFNGTTTTLGLDDFEPVKPAFTVSPNPAVQGSIVHFNVASDIAVYDTVGKLVLSAKETLHLDTTGFLSGVYFILTPQGNVQRLVVK